MPSPQPVNGDDAQRDYHKEAGSPLLGLSPEAYVAEEAAADQGQDKYDAEHDLSCQLHPTALGEGNDGQNDDQDNRSCQDQP